MCISLLILPYDTLMPVFAKEIFKGNARTFGYIAGAIGLGSIAGSFFLASLKKNVNLTGVMLVSIAVLGIGLLGFSRCTSFYGAISFAIIIGFASLTPVTAGLTIIQIEAAPHMRGRMMSYIAMAYFGMLPLGSLLAGAMSQKISAPVTMLVQGCIAMVTALIFSRYLRQERLNKKNIDELQETEHAVAKTA